MPKLVIWPSRGLLLALLLVLGCSPQRDAPSTRTAVDATQSSGAAVVMTEERAARNLAPPENPPDVTEAASAAPGPAKSAASSPDTDANGPAGVSVGLERADAALAREPGLRDTRAPLLIYTAVLTLAVFRVESALDAVETLARDAGGYLLERSDDSVVVRVPAPRFRGALDGIDALGDELHRQIDARDVTDEYTDLEIRLRSAEVMRQRLEALLAKATSVEAALAVERELERICQTIEQLKGRLKLLHELVAFSTITVHFQPNSSQRVSSKVELPFPWLRELGLEHLLSL